MGADREGRVMFWDYDYNSFVGRFTGSAARWFGSFDVEEQQVQEPLLPATAEIDNPLVSYTSQLIPEMLPPPVLDVAFDHPFLTVQAPSAFVDEFALPTRHPTFWSFNGNLPFGGDFFV